MCLTLAPARLSKTILYAAEAHFDGPDIVHVLGYQNTVQSRPVKGGNTGNAMILPFPALPGSMSRQNVVPTESCPHILADMAATVRRQYPRWRDASKGITLGPAAVEIFETGIYTVVLASDPRDIPAALEQVPPEKRPLLNPPIFDAYAVWYPGWTIVLCCFNNREAQRATPLLWWYPPSDPEVLFAPALDCHTGKVPDLTKKVSVDHTVAVGSVEMDDSDFLDEGDGSLRERTRINYRDELSEPLSQLLCNHVVGAIYRNQMDNGDFTCRAASLRDGTLARNLRESHGVQFWRVPPPGAEG